MIQVRCPECGYLQSLSEDRFVAIADDHLDCPHCNAKVPKTWNSVQEESAPEEAVHKIHAFSRRILNGGAVRREVVYALESLVRHHGKTDESAKALGVGYTELGEYKKAEEFLITALDGTPNDLEALRALFKVKLEEGPLADAVAVGRVVMNTAGRLVVDDDVAGLALALGRLGRTDKASVLLERYPDLDSRNALVKKARKELGRNKGWGFPLRLAELIPWERLMKRKTAAPHKPANGRGKEMAQSRQIGSESVERAPVDLGGPANGGGGAKQEEGSRSEPLLDYWIYAPESRMPEWETITSSMAEACPAGEERDRVLAVLESSVERKELSMDYIMRQDAEETFHYPTELLPRNSRNVTAEDREILSKAQMIIRLRLLPVAPATLEYLAFMVRFVEAVRATTGGVVQDALSHTLWGSEEWRRHAAGDPLDKLVETHVRIDVLDEGGKVWIHSHGLQKFGLPEIELDGVPTDMATLGRTMIVMIAETLVNLQGEELDLDAPGSITETPFLFRLKFLPPDEEKHFPIGSLKILPYVLDYDPESPDTVRHVLNMLGRRSGGHIRFGRKSHAPETPAPEESDSPSSLQESAIRAELLKAHDMARAQLPEFKRGFQQKPETDENVHAVKIGFPVRPGEYEWMWVTLDAWRGTSLVGQLENTPVLRKDLRKGSRVEMDEGEIFDWVISRGGTIVQGAFAEGVKTSELADNR